MVSGFMTDKTETVIIDEAQQLARKHTTAAIETLATALASDDQKAAIKAAEVLLARGYGAPTQLIETKIKRDPSEIPESELAEIVRCNNGGGSSAGNSDEAGMSEQPSSVH